MPEKKKKGFHYMDIPEDTPLRKVYAMVKEEFSAEDLQKHTEIEDDFVPVEQVLIELEEVHRKHSTKPKKKS